MLLADDHTMFRQGLATLLSSHEGMEVVGQTTNNEGAVALAQEARPDVVVMEVQQPMERSREFLRRMALVEPSPKVVICTMFEDPGYARAFLEMGASAYLVKSASSEHLAGALRAAVFDPEGKNVVVGMPRAMLEEAEGGSGGVLSGREMEILLLVSRGLSNRQVASSLFLSEATVARHLANVYPKIGVHSRGEAVRKALSEEWITLEEVTE